MNHYFVAANAYNSVILCRIKFVGYGKNLLNEPCRVVSLILGNAVTVSREQFSVGKNHRRGKRPIELVLSCFYSDIGNAVLGNRFSFQLEHRYELQIFGRQKEHLLIRISRNLCQRHLLRSRKEEIVKLFQQRLCRKSIDARQNADTRQQSPPQMPQREESIFLYPSYFPHLASG